MITYKIIEGNEIIAEEKSPAPKKIIMKGVENIIKRNCYKIDRIEESKNEIIYYVY